MYHEHHINLTVEHDFFATSHGKSPCDEISVTIKTEAENAINFEWCDDVFNYGRRHQ